MRIIAGEQRGKRLQTLQGKEVRPTSDMVKESLFNILQFQIAGRDFLDLFAGCGQIGIEALSRGAKYTTFVDASRSSIAIIERNLAHAGLMDRARVITGDALVFIANTASRFDLAFLDPPYHGGLLEKALPLVAEKMNTGGVIVCEHEKTEDLPQQVGEFILVKTYRYGKIRLSAYKRAGGEDEAAL